MPRYFEETNICVYVHQQPVPGSDTTKCTARVTLHSNGIISSNSIPHTIHKNHECQFNNLMAKENIMNKCVLARQLFPDSANKISNQFIYNREISNCKIKGVHCNLEYKKIKRSMDRVKNEKYPKRPSSLQEVKDLFANTEIINKYGTNLDKTEKLYIDTVVEEAYGFLLFASYATINMTRSNIAPHQRNYLIDGTFSCSPKMFYQVLIISVEFKNDVSILKSHTCF